MAADLFLSKGNQSQGGSIPKRKDTTYDAVIDGGWWREVYQLYIEFTKGKGGC